MRANNLSKCNGWVARCHSHVFPASTGVSADRGNGWRRALAFLVKNRRLAVAPVNQLGHPWAHVDNPAWHTFSARLGATEDQMEEVVTPSAHALEAGTAGITGATYELDPKSIMGG